MLRNRILVVSDDLEGTSILGNKPINTCAHQNEQEIRWFNRKSFSTYTKFLELSVKLPFKLAWFVALDPAEHLQLQRIPSLKSVPANLNVFGDPDLGRATMTLLFPKK